MNDETELWLNISPGDVYLTIRDADGYNVRHRVKSEETFEISAKERKRLSARNLKGNVFVAGRLRRVDEDAEPAQASRGYTEAELREIIKESSNEDFKAWAETEDELHVRRAVSIMRGESLGSIQQFADIRAAINLRWPPITYTVEQQELRAAGTFKVKVG